MIVLVKVAKPGSKLEFYIQEAQSIEKIKLERSQNINDFHKWKVVGSAKTKCE